MGWRKSTTCIAVWTKFWNIGRRSSRIEAHSFVSFPAYRPRVSLRAGLRPLAPGLTPRPGLKKFAAIQMLDAHFPTSDGRELGFRRHAQAERDNQLPLAQLGWELPPPPRITQQGQVLPE